MYGAHFYGKVAYGVTANFSDSQTMRRRHFTDALIRTVNTKTHTTDARKVIQFDDDGDPGSLRNELHRVNISKDDDF